MSDRTGTRQDASVGKLNSLTDGGSENSSHDNALRRELHSISSIGTNQNDVAVKRKTQALDAAPSLPRLSIEGREAKVAPESSAEVLEQTSKLLKNYLLSDDILSRQYSIRWQDRFLFNGADETNTINVNASAKDSQSKNVRATRPSTTDITGQEPLVVPSPEELRMVVGSEKEDEYRRAFQLLASFQNSVNQNIASPCIQRFADQLDQVERDMPKERFNALEEERKKYGLELDVFNKLVQEYIAREEAPLSNLLYILPPELPVRGKEMQEFDRTVKSVAGGVATEMKEDVAAGVANLTKKDGALISAEQLVQDYYERLEMLVTGSDQPENWV